MKKTFLFAMAVSVLFAACSSPSRIVSTWHEPADQAKNTAPHKIVVAAIIYDQTIRRQVEDYMVSLYPGQATPSYEVFGAKPLDKAEENYDRQLTAGGFDGIVIVRRTNENVSQHYVPGRMPMWYGSW